MTNTPKVMYGASFNVQEELEVLPLDEPATSVLIISMKVEFTAYVLFKAPVINSSTSEYKRYWDVWMREVKKRKLYYPVGFDTTSIAFL